MTAQLSMFTGRETLGAKTLKGKPIAPIGEGELALRVQDSRQTPHPRSEHPGDAATAPTRAHQGGRATYA